MEGVNPLYYEMKKANAELITPENTYKGLELAFTGGRIGGISNDITKIWNCDHEISEDEKKAIRWLCMETNFTIDYAKTLFKPTRPEEVDKLIKSYCKAKTPYFFQFAKGKKYVANSSASQVEEINDSMMNRIVKEIHTNKFLFKPIKNLAKPDYRVLLCDEFTDYTNDEVNKIFDRWNKKYGNVARYDDDGNREHNNIAALKNSVLTDLRKVEIDTFKVINSLVKFLYQKPSNRKKKLFWYIFGEQLYNNIVEHLDGTQICLCCGKRTNKLVNDWCYDCINKVNGKPVVCVNCGKQFFISAKYNKTECRCNECQVEYRRFYNAKKMQLKRTN